jgi:hypothetical protein
MNPTMNKIFSTFCLALVLLTTIPATAQFYYYDNKYYDKDLIMEFGGGFGGMKGITDVGRKKSIIADYTNLKSVHSAGSIFIGAMYQNFVGARLEVSFGQISGADSLDGLNKDKNLSFRSKISEVALIGEFHPLMMNNNMEEPSKFSPYIAAGIGWFSYNPQAYYQNKWVDLRPLRTEGQGFAEYPDREIYKLSQVSLPVGLGVRYELSQMFNLRFEILNRFTFTDYLDDASKPYIDRSLFYNYLSPEKAALAEALADRSANGYQEGAAPRGGFNTKDGFLTFSLKASINLGRQRIN